MTYYRIKEYRESSIPGKRPGFQFETCHEPYGFTSWTWMGLTHNSLEEAKAYIDKLKRSEPIIHLYP